MSVTAAVLHAARARAGAPARRPGEMMEDGGTPSSFLREARGARQAPARARGGDQRLERGARRGERHRGRRSGRRARGVAGRRRGRKDARGGLGSPVTRRRVTCPVGAVEEDAPLSRAGGSGGDGDRSGGSRAERVRRRAARSRTACRVVERGCALGVALARTKKEDSHCSRVTGTLRGQTRREIPRVIRP